jgi:hypothetical protein
MKITVTKRHIETACQRNSHHCMIADAIADSVDGAKFILVDLQSIRWTDKRVKQRYVYLTPPSAQEAIIAFDRGKRCKPFVFALSSPRIKNTKRSAKKDNRKSHHGKQYPGEHRRLGRVAYKDREFGIRRFKS